MTKEEIQACLLRALCRVAPEVDPGDLEPNLAFRDQLDMDSMDFLNFVIGLHEELAVEVPELDYPKIETMADCVEYLSARISQGGDDPPQ